jgi:LuxR family transcriptional regulator, quorum-sensing system regulator CviR
LRAYDLEHLEICRFVGVDYPDAALRQLPMIVNLRERPVVQRWVQTREPLVLQLPEDAQLMSERERFEVEAFQLGRLAIHGLVDLVAKTGSYFSFGQVPVDIDKRSLLTALALVAPLLHQALMAVHQKTAQPKPSPLSILSPAERELLQWVAAGRSNSEIAQLRGRSVATVRNQIHSAFVKLGVSSRTEAARIVMSAG